MVGTRLESTYGRACESLCAYCVASIPSCSYFIQKGADVNAVGGELRGTPLHWATRLVAILLSHVTWLAPASPVLQAGAPANGDRPDEVQRQPVHPGQRGPELLACCHTARVPGHHRLLRRQGDGEWVWH